MIHLMQDKILDLLMELAVSFITHHAIKNCQSLLTLDYSDKRNHKKRADILIGTETRQLLTDLVSAGTITADQECGFIRDVRKFYASACADIISKLPVNNELLAHICVLNPKKRSKFNFSSVLALKKAFPALFKDIDEDRLQREFLKFQNDPLSPEILEASRIDKAWALISDITDCEDQPKYPLLSGAALGLLVVPHSNASCERIFSLVRTCKTEQRLHVQQSLSKPHHPKS